MRENEKMRKMRREQTNRKETIRWDEIRPKEKRNKRENRGKPRKKMRGKNRTEGKQTEREREKMEIFSVFRRSKLDGLRRKVDPRIASYVRIPKSWSFVKLHEVGNFPTWNIFSLKSM